MIPDSAGSAVNARPGKPSVISLIHKIWAGSRGVGNPRKGANKSVQISPEFELIVSFMNLRMLS